MFRVCAQILAVAAAFFLSPAHAAVVSATGSGALAGAAAGLDLRRGQISNANVQGFDEASGVTVAGGTVEIDYLLGSNLSLGVSNSGVDSHSPTTPLTLSAGTYDSHMLIFSPGASASGVSATFTFDAPIVAVILSNAGDKELLNLSDGLFGTAATYNNEIGRRVEGSDAFTLTSANVLTLNALAVGGTQTDEFRILTEPTNVSAVPLPATVPLLLAGLGSLLVMRRIRA